MRRESDRLVGAALVLIAAAFALSAGFLVVADRIPPSADQAIVGLMARHILQGKGHPVFYYGATYGGTFEAHLLAVVFAIFGSSFAALRGLLVLFSAATVGIVATATRKAFSAVPALLAALYLCCPPFFFPYKVLTSDGHYASACLVTAALLLVALWDRERAVAGRSRVVSLGLLGFAGGFGLWVSPVTPPAFLAVVLWVLLASGPGRRPVPLLAAGAGFAAGSFPWWFWNARHGWASLKAPELSTVSVDRYLVNLVALVRESLPILVGATAPHRVAGAAAVVIGGAFGAVLAVFGVSRLLRRDPGVALFSLVSLALVAAAALPARLDPREPRFLVALYVTVAPLLGALLHELWSRPGLRAVAVGAGAAVLILDVSSLAAAPRCGSLAPSRGRCVAPLGDLLAALDHAGVRHVWTTYWAAYRISFESRERVVATPLASDQMLRYPPYQAAVQAAVHPALVLPADLASSFDAYLRETGCSASRVDASGYSIYRELPSETVAVLSRALSLPMPPSAYRVDWERVRVPDVVDRSSPGRLEATYRNASAWTWTNAVHLGAHWVRDGETGRGVEMAARGYPGRELPPGAAARVVVPLVPPPGPGRYVLQVGLVHEGVDWFRDLGGVDYPVAIEVR